MLECDLTLEKYEVRCGATGYLLGVQHLRYSNQVYLRHETKPISRNADPYSQGLCYCLSHRRPLTWLEKRARKPGWCTEVVCWTVQWNEYNERQYIEGVGSLRDTLIAFFSLYQAVNGVGCYIDGTPHPALVEVVVGGNVTHPSYDQH